MIAAVVLAAGFSRRMGCDKLHLPVDGVPMYRRTLQAVCGSRLQPRILVTNQPALARDGQALGFVCVPSPHAAEGMGRSVAAGAQAVPPECAGVMFLNADQPLLNAQELDRLADACTRTDHIIVPAADGVPVSPCVFPRRYLPALAARTGARGGRAVYQEHLDDVLFLPVLDAAAFRDVDDPASYRSLQDKTPAGIP